MKATRWVILLEVIILIVALVIIISTFRAENNQPPVNQTLVAQAIQTQCHGYCTSFENETVIAFSINQTEDGPVCKCIGPNDIPDTLIS